MTTITPEIVEAMAAVIAREVAPRRIVLFGSWARGDADRRSDVDILTEEEEPFGPDRSRSSEINRIQRLVDAFNIPVDILVFSRDEVEKWKGATNHIVRHALREGKTLYGRS